VRFCAGWQGVAEYVVVVGVDGLLDGVFEACKLGLAEVTFKDTALHVVEVLPAGAKDGGIALDRGVVDDDDVHRHHQIRNGVYFSPSRQVLVIFSASR
jgi:hypothetical protein